MMTCLRLHRSVSGVIASAPTIRPARLAAKIGAIASFARCHSLEIAGPGDAEDLRVEPVTQQHGRADEEKNHLPPAHPIDRDDVVARVRDVHVRPRAVLCRTWGEHASRIAALSIFRNMCENLSLGGELPQ